MMENLTETIVNIIKTIYLLVNRSISTLIDELIQKHRHNQLIHELRPTDL